MKNKKKLLIIIPDYNEGNNILNVINKISKISIKNLIINYVVINDGSKDNTEQILCENNINHIKLLFNLGIGGAIQCGYRYALENYYDYAVQFDGDSQHDENYIESLYKEIINGNDLVIGSRFISELSEFKSTIARRIGIRFLSNLIKLCTKKRIYDPTSGFRMCNQKIINVFANNYPIDYPEPDTIVSVIKKGYKVKEIPVKMNSRENGTSSINGLKSIYYMIKVSLSIIMASISTKKEVD